MVELDENLIVSIALKNATEHNGKANFNAVLSKLIASKPDLKKCMSDIIPRVKFIVDEINQIDIDEQKRKMENYYLFPKEIKKNKTSSLPELQNAIMGGVITRFPPEPNGFPHIGHAKAAIIDDEYAKRYKGKLILRFDDTNPINEKIEFYEAILNGLEWLGINPDLIKNTSDDIFTLYEYGKSLVLSGHAFVCTCSSEIIHKNRADGIECTCRKYTSLEKLNNFFKGSFSQNEAIVRFKGNMQDLNSVMRDPTLFRIIDFPHPLLGSKVNIWPTYDFVAPIEDSIDGVTHALRTKEYELRNELYYSILEILGLRKPIVIEFSRLEFEGIPVSKRKIKPLVESGTIPSWDDPRLPTLSAMKKRGFQPQAIRKFVMELGMTLAETKPSIEVLESINRKIIDPDCIRLFFVKNPVELVVNGSKLRKVSLINHPTKNLGEREIEILNEFYISQADSDNLKIGETIRLMELYNIKIIDSTIENNNKIIIAEYLDDKIDQKMKKIQWVAKNDIMKYQVSIPKQLYKGDDFNKKSLEIIYGYAESYASKLPVGTIIQFVRFGFCRTDTNESAIYTHR